METSKRDPRAYHRPDVSGGASVRRAAVIAGLLAIAGCRQIAGIQDRPKPCADPNTIDDLEDGDNAICRSNGRQGAWHIYSDGTSTDLTPEPTFKPTPIPNAERGASRYAAHMKGSGFTDWGALMAVDLNTEGVHRDTYDASFTGAITFWMKSNVPVTVNFVTPDTVQPANGGDCVDTATAHNCDNHFAFQITAPSPTWTQFRVPYPALHQSGSATWKPRELYGMEFKVGPGVPFDVWVDDLAFEFCSNTECLPTCNDPKLPVACHKRTTNGHPAGCFPTDADCAAIDDWCADPMLIDDLEDGDGGICPSNGRNGNWFVVGDGTSTNVTPPLGLAGFVADLIEDGGRGASHRAAHFSGSGFTEWGALMGLNMPDGATYDASTAGGITFWMKSNVPVAVQVLTRATEPQTYGGTCQDTATAHNCNNHFAFQITAAASDWKQVKVPFAALRQSGSAVWNPSQFNGVQFVVGPNAPFDVWIDDVAFYTCTGAACAPTCIDPKVPVGCSAVATHPAACLPPQADCASIDVGCGSDPMLIDNLEDGNGVICGLGGRDGTWFVGSDGTSSDLTPAAGSPVSPTRIPGGRDGSQYAIRLAGSGFTDWGAQMNVSLNDGAPYDASAATGLRFWMKGNAAHVTVSMETTATLPTTAGGTCDASAQSCYNAFYFPIAPDAEAWQQYDVPFAALRQPAATANATGNLLPGSATFDPSQLVTIKFTVPGGRATPPFEIWIDDLGFYTCSGAACLPSCHEPDRPVACPAMAGRPGDCFPAGTNCATETDVIHSVAAWGSGPNDVWAVGYSGVTYNGAVLHYDGAQWARVDVGSVPPLWDVTGSSAGDVWLTGDHGTVVRRSGSAWSSTTAGTDASLSAGWANSAGDAWAIAYPGVVRRWNGSTWSAVTSVDKWLLGLWASAPNDVWAVGDGGTILHFDGTAWSPKASSTTVFLNRVWGSSATDVWAVGDSGPVLHFDGTHWAASPGVTGVGYLGVWGSSPTDVWAVGYSGGIAHWNGTAWSTVADPVKQDLWDVWGSAANDVWAVGVNDTILHFDGMAWQPIAVTW